MFVSVGVEGRIHSNDESKFPYGVLTLGPVVPHCVEAPLPPLPTLPPAYPHTALSVPEDSYGIIISSCFEIMTATTCHMWLFGILFVKIQHTRLWVY